MPHFPDVVLWALPAFVTLGVIEFAVHIVHARHEQKGYECKDTATSVSMGLGSLVLDMAWKVPIAGVYSWLYLVTPLRLEVTWAVMPLLLLAQDFFYYWSHRSHHSIRVLWASHVVHHSSRHFNLSTAVRQSWTGLTAWVFYLPLIAAGVHPAALAFCSSVNLIYQFLIHTERIGRLPKAVEAVLNTPSHHRVHHASQGSYLDRNFGGILIVWDRVFGTFTHESYPCEYGLTKNIDTYNPLRVATHEYAAILRDMRKAHSWSSRFGHLWRSPGWSPDQQTALSTDLSAGDNQ